LSRLHDSPLGLREPRIRTDVVHDDRLAIPIRVAQRHSKGANGSFSGKGPYAACVLSANDVVPTVDFRIADTVRAQVFPKEPCGDFLYIERITERPERVSQPEQERLPLLIFAVRFF